MDEAWIHELLSGRRAGLQASVLRGVLSAASHFYSSAATLRNVAYDHNWSKVHRARVPVISLGNMTTGGTGKTPMAAWLANWLTSQGRRPGLLSRGYRSLKGSGSTSTLTAESNSNDEKLVLDRLCPGVPHLQQRDRVSAADEIVKQFDCDVLILDDGFQHRRLHRDLNLLLIDALQPWGYGNVLPRGLLREPLKGLRRADVVLITRSDQCPQPDLDQLKRQLEVYRGTSDCVEIAFRPRQLLGLDGAVVPLNRLAGCRVTAFCGIGNPNGFRQTLMSLGVSCDVHTFPDHHHYTAQDLARLTNLARSASADFVLTTQKDAVKFDPKSWTGPSLYAVEIGVDFVSGQNLLMACLEQLLNSKPDHFKE